MHLPIIGNVTFIKNNIYKSNSNPSSNIKDYSKYGVLSGIYHNYLDNIVTKPVNYNREYITKELNKAKKSSATIGKPNIIIVFSESFWDLEKLEDFSFSKEMLPNFKELKNKGTKLNLISPSYGGISSNVEFELMTSGKIAFYGNGYIPYMRQFYGNKEYMSAFNVLNKNGYSTNVINASSSKMFHCENV